MAMTRDEHLQLISAEECAEVAQRVSKALRFGLTEVQPGQPLTNAERIVGELVDLYGVISMLVDAGLIEDPGADKFLAARLAKRAKVEEHLKLSARQGTLVDPPKMVAEAVERLRLYRQTGNAYEIYGPGPDALVKTRLKTDRQLVLGHALGP